MKLINNMATYNQSSATSLHFKSHIDRNRSALASVIKPRLPSRQKFPMQLGKVEIQVVEQKIPGSTQSVPQTQQPPEIYFARTIENSNASDNEDNATNLSSIIDENISIKGNNEYRPRSSMKKTLAKDVLPKEKFQYGKLL